MNVTSPQLKAPANAFAEANATAPKATARKRRAGKPAVALVASQKAARAPVSEATSDAFRDLAIPLCKLNSLLAAICAFLPATGLRASTCRESIGKLAELVETMQQVADSGTVGHFAGHPIDAINTIATDLRGLDASLMAMELILQGCDGYESDPALFHCTNLMSIARERAVSIVRWMGALVSAIYREEESA